MFSCVACAAPITVPPGAALLLGPPKPPDLINVEKRHLCTRCYVSFLEFIEVLRLNHGVSPHQVLLSPEGVEEIGKIIDETQKDG